jgi:hypothetical protein
LDYGHERENGVVAEMIFLLDIPSMCIIHGWIFKTLNIKTRNHKTTYLEMRDSLVIVHVQHTSRVIF